MSLGTPIVIPRFRAVDANGVPIAGAQLFSWLAGTTTPQPLYADAALAIPLSNPVVADAGGLFPAMFSEPVAIKLELQTAGGVNVWGPVDSLTPTNLFTGLIQSLVTGPHAIGLAPIFGGTSDVRFAIGGVSVTDPAALVQIGLLTQHEFDASGNTGIVGIAGRQSELAVTLGAAGSPQVIAHIIAQIDITTGGATPEVIGQYILEQVGGARRHSQVIDGTALFRSGLEMSRAVDGGALVGDVNNWALSGFQRAFMIRVSASGGNRTITGLSVAGANASQSSVNPPGRLIVIRNTGAANNIVLAHLSGSSSAGNRFELPGAASLNLTPGLAATLWYDEDGNSGAGSWVPIA